MYRHGIDSGSVYAPLLRGKRLGLITNPTGLTSDFTPTIDLLHRDYRLTRLFAPEHGVRGDRQAGVPVADTVDDVTGVPVQTMFGANAAMDLTDIDAVVYDIQDIGLRFYTYIYVLADAMRCCAAGHVPLIVMDRADPLGPDTVRGTVLDARFSSGVGNYGLPTRYGLTVGEYARYLNGEYKLGCDLTVIPCEGLTRGMQFPDLGLPWVQQSPNMPTYETALAYEGTCLIEGTNVSEGRGTTKPFEMIGAPWLDNGALVRRMQSHGFRGVYFRTVFFEPVFGKYAGSLCRGIQLHVTEPQTFDGFSVGVALIRELRSLHTDEFAFPGKDGRYFFDLLFGNDLLRRDLYDDGAERVERERLARFCETAEKYRIYS